MYKLAVTVRITLHLKLADSMYVFAMFYDKPRRASMTTI